MRHALVLADVRPQPGLAALVYHRAPDAVLVLGDLAPDDLDPLHRYQGPKLGVHGNHDEDDGTFAALGIEDLHGRAVEVAGLTFGGLEGCRRYRRGAPFEHTEKEAAAALKRVGRVDVLVSHAPPEGVNDDPGDKVHGGWVALREHVEAHPPRLLLHGHTYPPCVVGAIGATRVQYVRGWKLVALPGA